MILSRRVSLGGVQLDEIHESVVIQSMDPGVAHENVSAVNRMGGVGQRVTGQHWETLEAKVNYAINIAKGNITDRRAVFDAVNAWAKKKGWLRMNSMPGRMMYVDKVVLPSAGDLRKWTDEFPITFRAYNVPFWQDETATQVTGNTAAGGTIGLDVPGAERTVLDAVFQNKSGKEITRFSITAGSSTIALTGLNLSGNGRLEISHGTDGLLRITADGTSVYNKYTGADDLYADPGSVSVSWTADRAGILTVSCRGRYAE